MFIVLIFGIISIENGGWKSLRWVFRVVISKGNINYRTEGRYFDKAFIELISIG